MTDDPQDCIDVVSVDDGPDPTHVCTSCRENEDRIPSAPTSTYWYCPKCDRVTRFERLDRQP